MGHKQPVLLLVGQVAARNMFGNFALIALTLSGCSLVPCLLADDGPHAMLVTMATSYILTEPGWHDGCPDRRAWLESLLVGARPLNFAGHMQHYDNCLADPVVHSI